MTKTASENELLWRDEIGESEEMSKQCSQRG